MLPVTTHFGALATAGKRDSKVQSKREALWGKPKHRPTSLVHYVAAWGYVYPKPKLASTHLAYVGSLAQPPVTPYQFDTPIPETK